MSRPPPLPQPSVKLRLRSRSYFTSNKQHLGNISIKGELESSGMFYTVLEGSRGFQGDFKSLEAGEAGGQEGGQEGVYEGGEEGEAGMAEKRRKAHIVGLDSRMSYFCRQGTWSLIRSS